MSHAFFRKKQRIPLETQLEALKACGIELTEGIEREDILEANLFETPEDTLEEIESKPYDCLIWNLGYTANREPFPPISNKLWLCDHERIENPKDYVEIIESLERITKRALDLRDITDQIDFQNGQAWVEFTYDGERIHWDLEVDNDWMDPKVVRQYALLLTDSDSDVRLHHQNSGQSNLIGAFTQDQYQTFRKLSKVKLYADTTKYS